MEIIKEKAMKKKPMHVERRKDPRFAISLPVSYKITVPPFKKQLKIKGTTKDISAGGAGIVASHMPTAPVMNLQIELPSIGKDAKTSKPNLITPKVRIGYSKPISKEHKDIYSTGVCFVEISKRDMVLLRKSLNQYKKSC